MKKHTARHKRKPAHSRHANSYIFGTSGAHLYDQSNVLPHEANHDRGSSRIIISPDCGRSGQKWTHDLLTRLRTPLGSGHVVKFSAHHNFKDGTVSDSPPP